MQSILITGTDTGIGKTRVTGIIARRLSAQGRVQVVKPVEAGCGARATFPALNSQGFTLQ
jgi:dethiobiotin synthetase